MAQHDYNIADQQGLSFLQDLNEALEAIVTLNSGATEPTTTYAGMLWLDTSGDAPVIKQRNKDNNGWNTLSSLIDAEVMPSPTAGGYVKRKADNTGNETKTAQQVADELAPLLTGIALPPGTVLALAASSPPAGFLKCNGATVSRTTYAALFAAIGTTFGVGDGSTTFNLPDLRGEFIRGWDDGRGVDAGRVLGTAQLGTVVTYDNTFANAVPASFRSGSADRDNHPEDMGADIDSDVDTKYPNIARAVSGASYGEAGFALSTQNTGVARPRNVALLYCIKY